VLIHEILILIAGCWGVLGCFFGGGGAKKEILVVQEFFSINRRNNILRGCG